MMEIRLVATRSGQLVRTVTRSLLFLFLPGIASAAAIEVARTDMPITVRTEIFGRPPYSSATYFIYDQAGRTVCTKLAVCNKYEQCETNYYHGRYVDWVDTDEQPFTKTAAVTIAASALSKHTCLIRFVIALRTDPKR